MDDQLWDGFVIFDHEIDLTQSQLVEGDNTVRIDAINPSAPVDQYYVNWLELEYWDTFVAEGNELKFSAPSASQYRYRISGFSDSAIQVFDISDPAAPQIVSNSLITPSGGGHQVEFQVTSAADSKYLSLTESQYKSPVSIELDQALHLDGPNQPGGLSPDHP